MKVSVVIPVYNTARDKFVRLLDSVLSQTEQSFEILVVDDGSAPETAAMLDDVAKKDSRISVCHQANQGKGGFPARYDGIAKARGDYVYIPDSDDVLHPRLLEYCLWAAETKGAEFVAFRYLKIADGCVPSPPELPPFDKAPILLVDENSSQETTLGAISLIHVDNWAQFARRELIQALPKREVSDLTRTFRLVKGAKKWAATPLQLYFYDAGVTGSVSHGTYSLEQITCLHKDLIELCDLYADERQAHDPVWEAICKNFVLGSLKIAYNAIRKRKLAGPKKEYKKALSVLLKKLLFEKHVSYSWVKWQYRIPYLAIITMY